MPKTKISEYSATANSNTDVASINVDEGCAPSGINNAIRAIMGHLKDFQSGTNADPFNGPVNGTVGATTPSTVAATTLTTSSTVTHNGGTANGVAYLNGSKVLTTGSALQFDGSNLGLGVTPSAWSIGKALQVGSTTSLLNDGSSNTYFGNNFYYNSGFKYSVASNYAAAYVTTGSGEHRWLTTQSTQGAGNAITFTQAMTLDASGNLGVGTTSPDGKFVVLGTAGSNPYSHFKDASGADFFIQSVGNSDCRTGTASNHPWLMFTNGSERARIASSGALLVGTTAAALDGASKFIVSNSSGTVAEFTNNSGTATQAVLRSWNAATSGNNLFQTFHTDAGATERGSITYNRGGGLLAYNTTSDYRAKTVTGVVENALAKLALLKPCSGRMNDAEIDIDFFVAHELQEIVPSAVTGEKDAVKEDGTPEYQMVDKSALIPLLTAAIQEQQALITSLTARIEALEA
jgi:hypothetical protein